MISAQVVILYLVVKQGEVLTSRKKRVMFLHHRHHVACFFFVFVCCGPLFALSSGMRTCGSDSCCFTNVCMGDVQVVRMSRCLTGCQHA